MPVERPVRVEHPPVVSSLPSEGEVFLGRVRVVGRQGWAVSGQGASLAGSDQGGG